MLDSTYKLNVNGSYEFDINEAVLTEQDIIATGKDTYHCISDNSSIKSKILSTDISNKLIEVEIDGTTYQVKIKDSYDQLVKKMGLSANVIKKLSDIKAPMPGLVLEIMVAAGDQLEEGDSIMILEAMKMENVIKAPGAMTIKEVMITKGDAVDKNQILINLED